MALKNCFSRIPFRLDYYIYQSSLNHDDIYQIVCLECCADLFVSQSSLLHKFSRAVCGNSNLAAHLSIDLDGILDLLLLRQGGIVFRPGMAQEIVFLSQNFPEFSSQIGSERSQQQHKTS